MLYRCGRIEENAEAGLQNTIGEVQFFATVEERLVEKSDLFKDPAANRTSPSSEIACFCHVLRHAFVPKWDGATLNRACGVDSQKTNNAEIGPILKVRKCSLSSITLGKFGIVIEKEKYLTLCERYPSVATPTDTVIIAQNEHAHLRSMVTEDLLGFWFWPVHDHHDFTILDGLSTNRLECSR